MSLAATVLQNIRVKNPDFDKNEHRLSTYGALDFFIEQSERDPLLTAEMKRQAMDSMGKTLQIPVINYDGDVTVSNVRSCTVSDAENTSALVGVTFATYAIGFTVVPAMYSNNEIDMATDVEKKLKKCARALGAALDSAAIAALEANKTQVLSDPLIYTFSSNVLSAPWEAREDILGDIEPMMNSNDFYGFVHVIGNTGVRSLLRKLAEHAQYNEVDKRLEWEGKYFHFTNRIANDTGKYGTFYAVESGNVDLLYRFDREAARGAQSGSHTWERYNMPYIGIPVGLHFYESVGDQSAIAGDATADLTCAIKQYYGFSVDVAFVVAYNSAIGTRANPIVKVEIAGGDSYARPVKVVSSNDDPIYTKAAS
jgi:hypothetical protein